MHVSPQLHNIFPLSAYRLEHLQTRHGDAFGPSVNFAVLPALEAPLGARASIKKHAHKEQVDQPPAPLCIVDILGESRQELSYAVAAADSKVLMAAMGRNARKRGVVVSLGWCGLVNDTDSLCMAAASTGVSRLVWSHLDDISNECHHVIELVHIHVEMVEVVA